MSKVTDALAWDGVCVAVCIYAVYEAGSVPPEFPCFSRDGVPFKAAASFRLEDEMEVLGGRNLVCYEVKLFELPADLGGYLDFCAAAVFCTGASFVWMAFEGGFDFEHLLTDDVADQIYFACAAGGSSVMALDDAILQSLGWRSEIAQKRRELIRQLCGGSPALS